MSAAGAAVRSRGARAITRWKDGWSSMRRLVSVRSYAKRSIDGSWSIGARVGSRQIRLSYFVGYAPHDKAIQLRISWPRSKKTLP